MAAFYPFNGNANDSSGNGNDGTVNGATLTTDRFNNSNSAYEFDGSNDYIEVNDDTTLDLTDSFSITLWLNQYSSSSQGYRLFDKTTIGINDGYEFDTYDASGSGRQLRLVGGNVNAQSSSTYNLNTWNQVLAIHYKDSTTLYQNGTLLGKFYQDYILSNNLNVTIGSARGSKHFFKGKLDDIRVYNRALCDNEIKILYGTILTLDISVDKTDVCDGESVNIRVINPQPYIKYKLLSAFDSSEITDYKFEACGGVIVLNTGKIFSDTAFIIKAYSDSNCFTILDTVITIKSSVCPKYNLGFKELQKIHATDRASGDLFGVTSYIDNDSSRIIIGARDKNSGAGAAYIYKKNNSGVWIQEAKLLPHDPGASAYFANTVCLEGGYAIVGSLNDYKDSSGNGNTSGAGSAYIFELDSSGKWKEVIKIISPDRTPGDNFGNQVRIYKNQAYICAYGESLDSTAQNDKSLAGALYIYERNSSAVWKFKQKLVASDRASSDKFGVDMEVSGNKFVIGAFQKNSSRGAAYIFSKNNNGFWKETQKLISKDIASGDLFGLGVELNGDIAVINAPEDDKDENGNSSISNAGSAYVFEYNAVKDSFFQTAKIVAPDRTTNDEFYKATIIGDNIVVSDYAAGTSNNGACYYYTKNKTTGCWYFKQKIIPISQGTGDNFGVWSSMNHQYFVSGAMAHKLDSAGGNSLNNAGAAFIFEIDTIQEKIVYSDTSVCYGDSSLIKLAHLHEGYEYYLCNAKDSSIAKGYYMLTCEDTLVFYSNAIFDTTDFIVKIIDASNNTFYLDTSIKVGTYFTDFTTIISKPCSGDTSFFKINNPKRNINYHWDFTGSDTANGISVFNIYNDSGIYYPTLSYDYKIGKKTCKKSIDDTLKIEPTPKFVLQNDTCVSDSFVIGLQKDSNWKYIWNTNDTTSSIIAKNSGTYILNTTFQNTICRYTDSVTVNLMESDLVSITIDSINNCLNSNSHKFSAQINISLSNDKILHKGWYLNDSFENSSLNYTKTHTSYGNQLMAFIFNTENGCVDTAYYSYYINPNPVSKFMVSDSIPCFEGNKIMVTDSGKIASGTYATYWDLGDGTDTSGVSNFTKSYSVSDTFKVTQVLVSDSGCTDTSYKNIRVKESPVAAFILNNNSQCLKGNNFQFTNTTVYSDSSKMNYIWTATNKGAVASKNLTLNYTAAGTYQTQLISYSNESCFDTINMNIRVNPNPVAGFTRNDTLQCLFSNNLKLDDTSKISSGTFKTDFYFGDGIAALNKDTVSHMYAAYGLYNLKQMVTSDSGCLDSSSVVVDIVENPVNKLVIDKNSTCFSGHVFDINSGVVFKQNTPAITFDFGDGKTLSDTFNGTYSYQKYGHYLIKVSSKNRVCEDHDSILVHVNPNPIAGFTRNDSLQCLFENMIRLDDTSKIAAGTVSANWYFGDGNSKLGSDTVSYHYTTYGLHTLKLVSVSDSGCRDSSFLVTDIVQNPVNKLSVDTSSLCFKGNIFDIKSGVVLTQASPVITFSLGDNTHFNDSFNGTHSYTDTGTYYVKMSSQNRMCYDYDSLKIRVNVHPDFYVPTDTCSEDSLVFSVKYNPDWKYQWSHGDTNNSIKLFNTGWYKLITTNRYTNCKTTDSMKVDFGEVPIVTITVDSLRKCLDDNALQITSNISIRGIKDSLRVRVWYVNDVAIDSSGDVFNYIHSSYGEKRIKVRAESWKTCKSFANFDYYVNPNPVADFVINDTLSCFEHHLIDLKDTGKIAQGNFSVYWDFGDDTDTSGPENIKKRYAAYDIYNIKEILTSDSGCLDSIQKTIRIKESPMASFVLNGNNSQCLSGNGFDFSNTSSIVNGGLKYAWNKGDLSVIDTNKNIQYSYQGFGTYPVLLEVTSDENCKDSAAMLLRVNPNPHAGFTINDPLQCSDINSVFLTDTSIADIGSFTNHFYFGDGFNKVGVDTASHHYLSYGLFDIKQVVTSDSGCLDSAFAIADIVEMPVNNLSTDKNSACLNGHVFNIQSGVLFKQNAPDILFSYGDGNTLSDSFDGQYSFQGFGTFTLKISSENRICKDEDSVIVRVNPNPVAGFMRNDTLQCLFENRVLLEDTSSIGFGTFTNNFYFGDGFNKFGVDTASHHYVSYGLFGIKQLVTSDSGCLDSAFAIADIVENPVNSLTIPDVSECFRGHIFDIKSNVAFQQNTPVKSFDFGDGNTIADTFNGTYSYLDPGKYWVKITSQNRICLDKDSMEVYVNPSPNAGFTLNDSLQCIQGNVYDMLDTTTLLYGNLSRTWSFSDATQYTTKNVQKTFKSFGGFDIRLNVVSDSGCTDSAFKSLHVMEMPSLEFMVNDIGQCFKTNDFKIAYNSQNLRYTSIGWDMADGTGFSGDTSFNYSYATSGKYNPKLIVKNEVCADSLLFDLFVNPEPKAALSINNPEQCFNGHEFVFGDNSSIAAGTYSAVLSLGDNTTNSPFTSYNYKYASAKNYNVKLKVVSDSACADSVVQLIKVFESPDASIAVDDSGQCFNGNLFSLKLAKKPIVNGTYSTDWYLNDGTGFTGVDSAKHAFLRFGNYTSRVIVTTGDNCKDTATRNLFVHPSPIPAFSVASVCFPEPSEFINLSKIDSGSIVTYNWLIDNADPYTSRDVTHYFNTTGSFGASLSITSDKGCTETVVRNNTTFVNPKPTAAFVFAELEDDQPEITWQFTSTSSGATGYEWFFNDGFFETSQQFTRDFSSDTITLGITHIAVSDSGCRDTAFNSAFISTQQVMYVPNAFTPGADDLNPVFKPIGVRFVIKYEMLIFNRWGEIIFQTNDVNKGWDGTYKGVNIADGTFFYSINYIDIDKKRHTLKGEIILLR